MASEQPETRLVGRIKTAVKRRWPRAFVQKFPGSVYASGIPDLLIIVEGRAFLLEVKAQRLGESERHAYSRATPQQRNVIAMVRRAGGVSGVVLTPEHVIELIEAGIRPPT